MKRLETVCLSVIYSICYINKGTRCSRNNDADRVCEEFLNSLVGQLKTFPFGPIHFIDYEDEGNDFPGQSASRQMCSCLCPSTIEMVTNATNTQTTIIMLFYCTRHL